MSNQQHHVLYMQQFTDRVCGMKLTPETAYSKLEYEGHTFYFCSKSCLDKFTQNPEKYVSRKKVVRN